MHKQQYLILAIIFFLLSFLTFLYLIYESIKLSKQKNYDNSINKYLIGPLCGIFLFLGIYNIKKYLKKNKIDFEN